MSCQALLPPPYRRRHPEQGVLHQVLRAHLETFVQRVDEDPSQLGLASFVESELRGYLRCGVLAHGFARCWCATCNDSILVAFSCKGRGFCPSCGGRRMAQSAARLIDDVLPEVPMRQWVLTLPYPLRYRLSWDTELLSRVLELFLGKVSACCRRLARARGLKKAQTGAYTVIQRFSSSLALNIHFHSLVMDGVFVPAEDDGPPVFHRLAIKEDDVLQVVRATELAVLRLLERRGLIDPEDGAPCSEDEFADQQPLLAGLYQASVGNRIALGERRGKSVRRIRGLPPSREAARKQARRKKPMCGTSGGFDLQAKVRIPASDRVALERLLRYLLRPAVCSTRLRLLPDGMVAYDLKSPWSDGTTGMLFSPLEFIEKLAALVPPPGKNLIRFHGVLAPRAKLRALIVPRASRRKTRGGGASTSSRHIAWAELLRRVFKLDLLHCLRCGGRREVIALIKSPLQARRILESLGLDTESYEPLPARASPQLEWAS